MSLGSLFTAMVTPFNDDFTINYSEAQRLARYLVENGSDGVVVSGTTGEAPTLSKEEKVSLFKAVKEAVGEKGKVIAGTGSYSTEDTLKLTKEAERVGVDAVLVVVPYYNKPPQKGLFAHFKKVAESTSLPVILYNVPSRTAVNLDAETTVNLSRVNNIMGIKEASGNLAQVAYIISHAESGFFVYSGDDSFTFPLLSLGGDGVISVASHLVGREMKEMIEKVKRGEVEEARKIHLRLLPLFKKLFLTTNPIMIKKAMQLVGFKVGAPRLPLIEASEKETEALKETLRSLGLI
jgi:4-hydroxy-tetrahydrodipicolinate synthase